MSKFTDDYMKLADLGSQTLSTAPILSERIYEIEPPSKRDSQGLVATIALSYVKPNGEPIGYLALQLWNFYGRDNLDIKLSVYKDSIGLLAAMPELLVALAAYTSKPPTFQSEVIEMLRGLGFREKNEERHDV